MTPILCNPDGSVRCLWTEAVPLETLGRLTVTRASTIEFNPVTQQWEVMFPGSDRVQYSDASRDACLQWERNTLNAQLLTT